MPSFWSRLPTGYFTHDLVRSPNPISGAPEAAERMDAIETRLMAGGIDERVLREECPEAPLECVLRAHDAEYVEALKRASEGDEAALSRLEREDMRIGPETYRAALKSAGAVVRAVDAVFERSVKNAFCAVRPPGHHAGRARASGFCFINNAAVGALHALARHGIERVAVLDFDVHHGDGTEEILAERPGTHFFSFFQWPLFPDRRIEPEPSNVTATQLPAGAAGADVRRVLEEVWMPGLERFRPQLLILSAGFDAHTEERMAQLKLEEFDYAYITRRLTEAAAILCEGRLVSVLEGGYSLRSLARSVLAHLQTLTAATDVQAS